MNTLENQELIKKYVDGTLDAAERQAFEKTLLEDPALQKEVEVYRSIYFVSQKPDLMMTSRTIAAIMARTEIEPEEEITSESPKDPPSVKNNKWWWGGGIFAVLMVGSMVFYQARTAQLKQEVRAELVKTYLYSENLIKLDSTENTNLAKAMRLYDAQDYAGAKAFLSKEARQTNDENALYYLGITQLLTGENEKAVETLTAVLGIVDGFYNAEAQLNLSLALLKLDRAAEAKDHLKMIENHPVHGEKARELLAKLD